MFALLSGYVRDAELVSVCILCSADLVTRKAGQPLICQSILKVHSHLSKNKNLWILHICNI